MAAALGTKERGEVGAVAVTDRREGGRAQRLDRAGREDPERERVERVAEGGRAVARVAVVEQVPEAGDDEPDPLPGLGPAQRPQVAQDQRRIVHAQQRLALVQDVDERDPAGDGLHFVEHRDDVIQEVEERVVAPLVRWGRAGGGEVQRGEGAGDDAPEGQGEAPEERLRGAATQGLQVAEDEVVP